VVALAAAFAIAVLATPAGIYGAVLLLPFQVSVLGTPSPAVTPTNLLYNVVATPGALYRYWRQGQTGGRLALLLIAGTLPGVTAGSVIRVELLPGAQVFDLVVGAVLAPLGGWLGLSRPPRPRGPDRPGRAIPPSVLVVLAAAVGCVGGIYGIADVLTWQPGHRYQAWHDRAVFHFLTGQPDPRLYAGCCGCPASTRCFRAWTLAGISFSAWRRTMSGTSSLPMPRPWKLTAIVSRELVSLRGSTVTSTVARMGPSMPRTPQVPGGSMWVISDVTTRLAPPMRRDPPQRRRWWVPCQRPSTMEAYRAR
jgi:Sulfite exporter TauE/SafE